MIRIDNSIGDGFISYTSTHTYRLVWLEDVQ